VSCWSEEQLALQESARAFVRSEVVPHLQTWEDAGEVPPDLHRKAAEPGGGSDVASLRTTAVRSLVKLGWHCSDTAELGFRDVRVPVTNLVGEENTGFAQIAQAFVTERLALAAHGYGIVARALALTVDHCRERETFGRPLDANQVVQHTLVERHYRDARILGIGGGATEVLNDLNARLLGYAS
jgi:alkylation response protein AidB-like acyl-CoA dehydrogenase